MPKLHQHQRHNIILERLNNGETLSITELAREWDTTTKTVQRDFDKLQQGNYGVVRADDGKRFNLSREKISSKSAATAIKVLDSLASDIGGAFYTKAQAALHKIQNYIDSPFYIRIDMENISDKLEIIEKIEEAISQQKMLTFEYRAVGEKEFKHHSDVKPYRIIIFRGFWYLLAKSGQLVIKYYLGEIKHLKVQKMTFQHESHILERLEKAHDIWFNVNAEPFEVTLFLDKWTTIYFQRKPIKGQFQKKNSDGTSEVTISVTHKKEIFSILKTWLPQIKVLEPYELQEEFEEMLKNYTKSENL